MISPRPNLADPDFEPTDEQLAELCRRALEDVKERHRKGLQAFWARIEREGELEAKRWAERQP